MTGIALAFVGGSYGGPPPIGSAYGGGYFAGQISTTQNSIPTHYLIVAPKASGQSSSKQWKTSDTFTANTSSGIDGPTNSSNMNDADHPAAQFCEGLTIGGFSDWYMPAHYELEILYYNLKPTTQSNNTIYGTNSYAYPNRNSSYTTSTPGQTGVTDFRDSGSEAFNENYYWSSTATTTTNALYVYFYNGTQTGIAKTNSYYVRAVRRVPVPT